MVHQILNYDFKNSVVQDNPGRIVAIKCIERSRLTKASTENLFTEIKVMRELNHEHIVRLEDFEVRFLS